jgi:putative membrane-bound dehydrogenase-like protein
MRKSYLLTVLLGMALLTPPQRSGSAAKTGDGWIPLCNGRDLTGWHTTFEGRGKNDRTDDLVRVHDGILHFYPQARDGARVPLGYLATDKAYSFYHLRFEYRWGGKRLAPRLKDPRSSGLIYHAVGQDPLRPRGVACRVREGDTGDLVTVSGTRVTTTVKQRGGDRSGESHYLPPDQGGVVHTQGTQDSTRVIKCAAAEVGGWNKVEVIVKGGSAVHVVNGKVVNRCTDIRQRAADGRWVPLTAGRLVFQAEAAEVMYRNIAIRPVWGGPLEAALPPANPGPARPFVPARIEVPDGYTVELAAGPPLVRHPMMACFDDAGRLFVAESAGLNLEARDLELVRPNSIRLLTSTQGDGKFDRAMTFADKLTFPMGVAWKAGALYVASPPYVWRFRDTRGAGVADDRTPLVGRFNDSGIGDSLHGTVFGPDGRLYWVHGIGGGGHEVRDAKGRLVVRSRAPGIFSCWPDGSDVRKHCAGGMNNPVELDFTEAGQVIGTVNLLWGNPRNDALVQWMWGGAYTNNEHLIQGVKRTGDLLGPTYSFGHAAVSGLTRLRSRGLGDGFQDSFLVAEFNTQRIRQVRLSPAGSTHAGEGWIFLRSPNRDVHFTDVLEDADGSILVVDTGGWFRNGCPESQVARPDVPGAIYRIRRKAQPRPSDPRGLKINWTSAAETSLLKLLNDERFVVRDRAADELARRGEAVIPGLKRLLTDAPAPRRARLNAVWALCRMHSPAARTASRAALADKDATVREAAVHAVFSHRDREAVDQLLPLLRDTSPSVRRETATALGVLGNRKAVPALREALAGDNDRLLEHALVYALIEIDDRAGVLPGLAHASPRVRRAALIALDQMDHGNLTSGLVVPLLGSADPALERTALEVVSRHRGWAGEIVALLRQRLGDSRLTPGRLAGLRGILVAFSGNPRVQRLVADTLSRDDAPLSVRLLLLEAMARSELRQWPALWTGSLEKCLRSRDAGEIGQAIAVAAASRLRRFDRQLQELAADPARPKPIRIAAAAAFAASGQQLPASVLELLIDQCGDKTKPVERLAAARALAGARLDASQRRQIARLLAGADPLVLPVLADALEQGGEKATGLAVVAALARAPGLGNFSAARLERLLAHYPAEVRRAAAPLLKRLRARAEGQVKRLEELRKLVLTGGEPRKGRQVFRDPRALCLSCHRVGREGEDIGPDLSRIGATRTRADLLEAIVMPSASFARGFEPYQVTTARGKVYSGMISRQTSDAIYLRQADRSEIRLARAEVESLAPGKESIMPQGLDRVLTGEELRDLVAYLASLGAGAR